MELNDYGVEKLKVAIVEKAVIDYIRALRNAENGKETKYTHRDIIENESFLCHNGLAIYRISIRIGLSDIVKRKPKTTKRSETYRA